MGKRKEALCPVCYSLERHRLQALLLKKIEENSDLKRRQILHFAPEKGLKKIFQHKASFYYTTDLNTQYSSDIDFKSDITFIPFKNETFDIIWASHILEHVKEDEKAIHEIARVLKKGGIAVLPVPVNGEKTVEYDKPNEAEEGHVRQPGFDYFKKYSKFFEKVEIYSSNDFDNKYRVAVISKDKNNKWFISKDYVPLCIK
ncbi:MAG: class I SAM-dependent methyltransferase [Chitinispirillia bacterium]|jgi:SAM-dependent methyltransferase